MNITVKDYLSRLKAMLQPARLLVLAEPMEPIPRWGHGKAPHEKLYAFFDRNREQYKLQLERFLKYQAAFDQIARDPNGNCTEPNWKNGFLPALDAVSLYGFLAQENPAHFYEIGSGNSTMFARRAIRDHNLKTRITSFDPQPRAKIDAICDRSFRIRLEDSELSLFDELEAGDVIFFDGSHCVLENNDVVVFFLEVLPKVKPGVIVHMHDVFLPSDYPQRFGKYGYAEHYLLAAYFLGGSAGLEILLPNSFISEEQELLGILNAIWQKPNLRGVQIGGASMWMRTVEPGNGRKHQPAIADCDLASGSAQAVKEPC